MRVLIIGAKQKGSALLQTLYATKRIEVIAIIDEDRHASGFNLAHKYNIPFDVDWKNWIDKDIDIIIESTGEINVADALMKYKNKNTILIPGTIVNIISELFDEKEHLLQKVKLQMDDQQLILNNIRDGMIVVDNKSIIQFVNKSAKEIIGMPKKVIVGYHIGDVIKNTRLPNIIRNRKKEVNQKLILGNGQKIITTRIPMINNENKLIGAFALFKDITEVMNLAEENTDLREIKTMFEAIIQSSEEAISVVDENGTGLIINPAYTRLTGLSEEAVIGKPATADISEGDSVHMKVLQTRRPIRGAPMKIGPGNRRVLVNAAPVIVDDTLKGSVGVIHDVSEITALTNELRKAHDIIRNLEAKYTFNDIIGPSSEMMLALEQAKVGARTPATVLLRGESGTGKELFAHAIHNESERQHHKFIRVNCAAIAETLLESELFGYEEGAFSGAKVGGKKGFFEEAHHGSIFLDEIGELSLSTQAKLLRVLQENEIVRVGGTDPISIDPRIITATNVNLEKAIMNKTFREDLYYRLNRLPIFIPSLRERLADLPSLAQHLIYKINQEYGRTVRTIDEDALHYLDRHHWPGNIRELENIIGRAIIYMNINEEKIRKEHIPDLNISLDEKKEGVSTFPREHETLKDAVSNYEREFICKVYKNNDFNKTKTAKALDISIRSLYYKFEKLNIE